MGQRFVLERGDDRVVVQAVTVLRGLLVNNNNLLSVFHDRHRVGRRDFIAHQNVGHILADSPFTVFRGDGPVKSLFDRRTKRGHLVNLRVFDRPVDLGRIVNRPLEQVGNVGLIKGSVISIHLCGTAALLRGKEIILEFTDYFGQLDLLAKLSLLRVTQNDRVLGICLRADIGRRNK